MGREYYFGQNERLVLTAWNSLANVVLTVQGVLENSNGEFVPFSFQQTPTSDRVATVSSHLIGLGWLHNLVVFPSAGSPVRGQTYCRLTKRYGSQAVGVDTAVIGQGYVSDASFLPYPGNKFEDAFSGNGYVRTIVGTDPAVGVGIVETVPTGAIWRLLAFKIVLTTDATVVNRRMTISFDDGTDVFLNLGQAYLATANTIQTGNWGAVGHSSTMSAGSRIASLPADTLLPAGYRILTTTLDFKPGDDYAAPIYQVEEWIQP